MPERHPISIRFSSLTYQPYECSGESGLRFWLWRVEIDGKLFSKSMSPFRASDDRVERYGCGCCGVAGDGMVFYDVRRLGDRVIWSYEEVLEDSGRIKEFENLPELYVFDGGAYEKELGAGSVAELPELTIDEMRALLLRYLPPAALALYVNPESPDDSRGCALLQQVHRALSEDGEITPVSGCPEEHIEISIGLDLPGVPECRWLVGKNETGVCAMFVAFPQLPCWIGGQQVTAAFDTPNIARLLIHNES